jgi:hypothetical protein
MSKKEAKAPKTGAEALELLRRWLERPEVGDYVEAKRVGDPFPVVEVTAWTEHTKIVARTRAEVLADLGDEEKKNARLLDLLRSEKLPDFTVIYLIYWGKGSRLSFGRLRLVPVK